MLTKPEISLPAAHKILQDFSKISFYKINPSKSCVLELEVAPDIKQRLLLECPFPWTSDQITYLGILITPYPSDLLLTNLKALKLKISEDLKKV